MLRSPTVEKLQALRLRGLLAAWQAQGTRARPPVALCAAGRGARNSPYVEATSAADLPSGIHAHAFESLAGGAAPPTPDTQRGAILRPDRDAPDAHPTSRDCTSRSGTTLLPARGRRPPKRATGETAVRFVPRWIRAARRHRPFFPLAERNATLGGRFERPNSRRVRRLPTSRQALIATLEKLALRPLPTSPHAFAERKRARGNTGSQSCLGLFQLGSEYAAARLEAACARGLTLKTTSSKSGQSILRTGLDQHALVPRPTPPPPAHAHVRGSAYSIRKEASDVA